MTVHAIVPIRYGLTDGSGDVKVYEVGEEISEGDHFDEAAVRALILGGSAVEVGKTRKYTEPPAEENMVSSDAATRKRDELINVALTGGDVPMGVIPQSSTATVDGTPGGDLLPKKEDAKPSGNPSSKSTAATNS